MDQISIKYRKKSRSGGLWGRFGSLLGRLGRSKASLETSWTFLEASWRRLGGVMEAFWPLLGAPWGRLGPSWNVVGGSRRRLGASYGAFKLFLRRFYSQKTVFLSHAILDAIFQSILARCCARNLMSESRKSLNSIEKIVIFCF